MSTFLLALFVLLKIVKSMEICNVTSCVYEGYATTYLAGNDVDSFEMECSGDACKADTSSGINLIIVIFAKSVKIICLDQDACNGAQIYIGVIPDGLDSLPALAPSGMPGSVSIHCVGESSCKEMDIIAAGDYNVIIKADGKTSFEEGSINCGIDSSTKCAYECNKEVANACKQVTCMPISNCICIPNGIGEDVACPTVEPTKEPTSSPVLSPTSDPTKSPVIATESPTGTPTASPPTASTSPTQAPTTPIPTESPITSTLSPTASPTLTPPLPPKCITACQSQNDGNCIFNGQANSIYVCGNNFKSCTMNCIDCESITLYSGSLITNINCLSKDSCKNANLYIGSENNKILNECDNFLLNDLSGIKESGQINCKSESSCKDIKLSINGIFTNNFIINIEDESDITNGLILCDIGDSSGNCIINNCNNDNSCKDLIFECLSLSSQCQCNGNYCPSIQNYGDSPCQSNDTLCQFNCQSNMIYAIKNDVNKVIINGNDKDRQCQKITVYSSAKETIFNGNTFETFKESIAYIGSLLNAPKGHKLNEFQLRNDDNKVTFNFNGKASGKDFSIYLYGNIDGDLNALNEQSGEGSLLYCDIHDNYSCIKSCIEYDESCLTSITVCPNNNTTCQCNDIYNPNKNSSHTTNPASSCSPTLKQIPLKFRKGISSNTNNINSELFVSDNKSKLIIKYFVIVGALLIVFIIIFILYYNYKSSNPLLTHLTNKESISQALNKYNTFNVEMGSTLN